MGTKGSSRVETVRELEQERSHGESEGANSAGGFCPSGLPLFQLRYRFNSGTLRCIQNCHWSLISHGRGSRPPSRRDYSWVFFPRFFLLNMFFRLDSCALHRSVKFQVPDDFPGYSLGSLLIPEHYQDDLAYILLSAGALRDRYEWKSLCITPIVVFCFFVYFFLVEYLFIHVLFLFKYL